MSTLNSGFSSLAKSLPRAREPPLSVHDAGSMGSFGLAGASAKLSYSLDQEDYFGQNPVLPTVDSVATPVVDKFPHKKQERVTFRRIEVTGVLCRGPIGVAKFCGKIEGGCNVSTHRAKVKTNGNHCPCPKRSVKPGVYLQSSVGKCYSLPVMPLSVADASDAFLSKLDTAMDKDDAMALIQEVVAQANTSPRDGNNITNTSGVFDFAEKLSASGPLGRTPMKKARFHPDVAASGGVNREDAAFSTIKMEGAVDDLSVDLWRLVASIGSIPPGHTSVWATLEEVTQQVDEDLHPKMPMDDTALTKLSKNVTAAMVAAQEASRVDMAVSEGVSRATRTTKAADDMAKSVQFNQNKFDSGVVSTRKDIDILADSFGNFITQIQDVTSHFLPHNSHSVGDTSQFIGKSDFETKSANFLGRW